MLRFPMFLALLMLLLPNLAQSQAATNYCLDDKTNDTWSAMLQQSLNDDVMVKLFSLRIGLCELVKRKVITLDQATEVFEQEREKAIYERNPIGNRPQPKRSFT